MLNVYACSASRCSNNKASIPLHTVRSYFILLNKLINVSWSFPITSEVMLVHFIMNLKLCGSFLDEIRFVSLRSASCNLILGKYCFGFVEDKDLKVNVKSGLW